VLARARKLIADQLIDGAHRPVILVSHDVVIRILLASLDPGLVPAELIPQRTGCWNLLTHTHAGWQVDCLDQNGPRS
jgi:broad specificity phosphatase PhoE